MPECNRCGNWVSHAFARVAKVDGELKRCMNCAPNASMFQPDGRKYRCAPNSGEEEYHIREDDA